MTDKFEGCVVREMRRLDELMKNLHLAAKVSCFCSCVQSPLVSETKLPAVSRIESILLISRVA